jgi:hypothetical protein
MQQRCGLCVQPANQDDQAPDGMTNGADCGRTALVILNGAGLFTRVSLRHEKADFI